MNNYTNPYIRLQAYYSWLSSSSNHFLGMSILDLHNAAQIPLPVIRQDLVTILAWQAKITHKYIYEFPELDLAADHIPNKIFFDIETTVDASDSAATAKNAADKDTCHKLNLEDQILQLESGIFSPELQEYILNGELDDILLFMENYYRNGSDTFDIALSYDESLALDAVLKDLAPDQDMKLGKTSFFQIKDNYRSVHDYRELASRLQLIDQAIKDQMPLLMKYRSSHNKVLSFSFQPLKISYDESENLYCVLSIFRGKIQIHRLDRIIGLWNSTEKVSGGDVSLIDELAPQVWGNCFSEEPQQVKVKFYNEANVWNKVKQDLACRTKGQLYEKDGFLYYEDTVYGISKFRPWIYGFGRSAIVLEPKSLREHIIASLKERKNRDQ